MLKKIKKHLFNKRQAAVLALALAISAPASADTGPITFFGGGPHTVPDNIVADSLPGLQVLNPGTTVVMSGHSITTNTIDPFLESPGAKVQNGGLLILDDVTVRTLGPNSTGLLAETGSARITVTGGSVTVAGSNPSGAILANANGIITLNGVSIVSSGANTNGCKVMGVGSSILLINSTIRATGYALVADTGGGAINATVSGQDISGAGGLIMSGGPASIVNLTAAGSSRLYGITAMNGGGIANLAMGGASVWTVPGDSVLATLALNGGTVSLTPPSSGVYKTLSVAGNLSGSGGTFNLNADLAAGQYDLINVNGAASGSHRVFVLSQGNAVNLFQAVKVVNLNEAAINTATFSGGGDFGAYRYGIASGAAVPAGYSGIGSLDDIYLYNTFAPSTPASAAISASASPSVLWYSEMNDIKKRLGELRLGAPSGDFWARTYAGKYTVKPSGGHPLDQISRGLEIGNDNLSTINGGKRYLGWVAGGGRADNTFAAGGSGATDSFYIGAYGSWLRDDGSYIDVVGKHNWFHHSFSAPLLGGGSDSAAYKNNGFGLSIEAGKRIERGNGVFVEPQVELAAMWSEGKNYFTANGLNIATPATTSLQLRMGAAFGKKTAFADGSRQVYGKLAWVEELAGQSRTTVDTASFESSLKGGRLVAGLGFVEDTAKRQLYLDIETAWGKTTSKPWGVNLGCRWKL